MKKEKIPTKKRSFRMSDQDWELCKTQGEFFGLNRTKYMCYLLHAPLIIPNTKKYEKNETRWY